MTEAIEVPKPSAPDVRLIPLSQMSWGTNIRETRDEDLAELVASIKASGLLEPVLVRPHRVALTGQVTEKMKADFEARPRYELVCGFRRRRAAELAGLEAIPALVREMSTDEVLDAQLIENLQREDLDAIEEAGALQRRLESTKITQAELAKKIGKSQPYVANRLRLLGLRPEVQEHIRRGMLTQSAAEVLLEIPKEAAGLQGAIAKKISGKNLPVQDLKREVKWQLEKWTQDQQHRDAAAEARKHKFPKCPFKDQHYGDVPIAAQVLELEGHTILSCSDNDYSVHRWDADTGERYFTPAERKEVQRRAAEASRTRKEAAKKAKDAPKVVRDYGVLFTRATPQEWADALLKQVRKDISGLRVSQWGGFEVDVPGKIGVGDLSLDLDPVDVQDGNGGKFHTRIRIGNFQSGPTSHDDVAEGSYVKEMRKARNQVLVFQRSAIGWKQGSKELWPEEISGFKVGEKVRVGAKAPWSSYVGKQGVILALDWREMLPGGGYMRGSTGKRGAVAVLDIAASHKVFWISSLEHLEAKKA